MNDLDPVTRGRLQLIMIGLVFLGPLFLAWLLYEGRIEWQPGPGTQHGDLLQPPAILPDIALTPKASDAAPRFHGKWSLIVFDDGACAEPCRDLLYETRQVRRALGRDRDRVQRLLCVSSGAPDAAFLDAEHPGLVVLDYASPAGRALAGAAGIEGSGEFGRNGDVFLADPLGNLIMRFPAGTDMKGMHEDLKKLLKISGIG